MGLVLAGPPHDRQPWVALLGIEPQMNVIFVVPQGNIKPRLMFFDQGVFEDERFFFRMGDEEIDRHHGQHTQANMVAGIATVGKILPDAVAEILRLAHIDDRVGGIFHQIDAGGVGKPVDLLTQGI